MTREVIHTDRAPSAIGPYSQGVRVGETLYLSGQIPLDPESMELVRGDIRTQVQQVFDNLQAVCEEAGASLADTVKLNIYLTDLGNFGVVNEMMEEAFDAPYPARAAIGVASLPRGAGVEMDAVVVRNSA